MTICYYNNVLAWFDPVITQDRGVLGAQGVNFLWLIRVLDW